MNTMYTTKWRALGKSGGEKCTVCNIAIFFGSFPARCKRKGPPRVNKKMGGIVGARRNDCAKKEKKGASKVGSISFVFSFCF